MKILDMSAGMRSMWFNKNHPDATYLDCRPVIAPSDTRHAASRPDVVGDSRDLPPEVGDGYSLIVFDPPHEHFGTGRMGTRYGAGYTNGAIRDLVARSSKEAHRVSIPGALMVFKWHDRAQPLKTMLTLMSDWEPLLGQVHVNGPNKTHWILLVRK